MYILTFNLNFLNLLDILSYLTFPIHKAVTDSSFFPSITTNSELMISAKRTPLVSIYYLINYSIYFFYHINYFLLLIVSIHFSSLWQQTWGNQLKGGKIYPDSWFQLGSSIVSKSVVKQYIMSGNISGAKLPTSWQQWSREREVRDNIYPSRTCHQWPFSNWTPPS